MKHFSKLTLVGAAILAFSFSSNVSAQSCPGSIFSDDYSNPALWSDVGAGTTGNIAISGGACTFTNFAGHQNRRLLRPLGGAISSATTWRSEFTFRVDQTSTVGAILLALTENSLHPQKTTPNSGIETNNSGLRVNLANALNQSGNYWVNASSKYQTTQGVVSGNIAVNSFQTYYMRLERQDATHAMLSIFTDAARTIHTPGSPQCFDIDSRISNLDYAQHGVNSSSGNSRRMTGWVDNLCIFEDLGGELCEGVDPCPIYPGLEIDVDPTNPCNIIFTESSNAGAGMTILYPIHINFGDGTTGTLGQGQSINHAYSSYQSFLVCYTVFGFDQNMNCCSKEVCEGVTVFCDRPAGKNATEETSVGNGLGESHELQLYPNPANDKVNLSGNGTITSVRVADVNGRVVFSKNSLNNDRFQLDISEFTNGIYFIQTEINGETVNQKFVKQ